MAPKEATTWQVDFRVAFDNSENSLASPGRRAAGARSGVMISIRSYALLSALATVACVLHAIQLRKQFYSIVIHLAASKLSVTILGNMAFVAALLFAQFMRQIFLGSLRAAELDRLYEKIWFAITETCLALTIFREELKFRFVFLFTVLLFVKVFHWLSQFRVEQFHTELQASPRPARHAGQLRCQPCPARHSSCRGALRWGRRSRQVTTLTHMRINSLMALLFVVDCFFIVWQAKTLLLEGPSFLLLFAFEYVILLTMVVTTFLKYLLYVVDMRRQGRWSNKAVFAFYLNLVSDLSQLFVYLIFFSIVFSYYGAARSLSTLLRRSAPTPACTLRELGVVPARMRRVSATQLRPAPPAPAAEPPPSPPRTQGCLSPPLPAVLTGHVSPPPRTKRTRLVPPPRTRRDASTHRARAVQHLWQLQEAHRGAPPPPAAPRAARAAAAADCGPGCRRTSCATAA